MVDPSALTVVVPMYNAPENLERCLEALARSSIPFELVVVDDCSTDERAVELARSRADRYVRMDENSGPGLARNAGVEVAGGDVVAFIDSDVLVEERTLEYLRDALDEEPEAAAVFGSYDDRPASPGIVTEYRNLLHHWTHQNGPREATTFWAGCGAVRRDAFRAVGGFDVAYRQPSIEDIELGMRFREAGHRVLLRREILCKHLKCWRFVEMVRIDVTKRAIPWTRLLMERPGVGADLNLEMRQRACVALVFLALFVAALGVALPFGRAVFLWAWGPAALLAPVLWMNRSLYALFLRTRGPLFTVPAVLLHLFYFLYAGVAYLYARAVPRPSGTHSGRVTA